jgi:hypothetical protein
VITRTARGWHFEGTRWAAAEGLALGLPWSGRLPVDNFRLRDLDGDGVAEVVARVFTGGASCCVAGTIVTGTGAVLRRDFGRTGVRVADDGDLVTADGRLDGAFASTAGSAMPVLVLRLRDGRLVDVTDRARARRDAERLWLAWRSVPRADRRFAAGVLAAWAADRRLRALGY